MSAVGGSKKGSGDSGEEGERPSRRYCCTCGAEAGQRDAATIFDESGNGVLLDRRTRRRDAANKGEGSNATRLLSSLQRPAPPVEARRRVRLRPFAGPPSGHATGAVLSAREEVRG